MKLLSAMMCIFCTLCFTTTWAADSNHTKFKKAYLEYRSLFNKGEYIDSLPYARQAMDLGKAIAGANSKTYAILSHNYGINLLRAHRAKQASKVLSDTVALYKEVYGSEAQELIGLYVDLSDAQRSVDYKSRWYELHEIALSIAKKVYGKHSVSYGMLLVELGQIEMINQAPNGEYRVREGYGILKKLDVPDPDMSRAEFVMGKIELAHHHYKDARTHLERSLHELNKKGADSNFELSVRAFLVKALENLGESKLATQQVMTIGREQAEAGISNLKPLFITKPRFPTGVVGEQTGTLINVKQDKEGTVVVGFDVDKEGFTRNIRVLMLVGPEAYVKPAIEAVKQFRYAPRFVNGKPVGVIGLQYTFNFLL